VFDRRIARGAIGHRASVTYPSGTTILYSYNANGRVSALSQDLSKGKWTALPSQIAWQPFGPAASWLCRANIDRGEGPPSGGPFAITDL
jgi:YD repeat-containing protein